MASTLASTSTAVARPWRTGARLQPPEIASGRLGARLALRPDMLTTLAALLLAASQPGHKPAHTPAVVTPPCDVQLRTIVEAQRTLAGLQRSERALRRRERAGGQVERLLHPIANQARALEALLDAQERAYLRCVEAQLDAQAQPTTAREGV